MVDIDKNHDLGKSMFTTKVFFSQVDGDLTRICGNMTPIPSYWTHIFRNFSVVERRNMMGSANTVVERRNVLHKNRPKSLEISQKSKCGRLDAPQLKMKIKN
eukprot:TRINITY_DN12078_c0_g1_i1.p1 TRINITY_DN12078_c0_g1~~TRINITY_DN12078_c0_g1_i1.p1  ORF type:complete len:102 (+),score=13.58 TRINITY_DN12078_c0_g1_i1:184-489(+)